jgi:hypothetical protein
MSKLFLIGLFLALSGCATVPEKPPIDAQCDVVGNYARSIAILRDMGVSLMDIESFTTAPSAVTFPFQRIKREAYWLKTETPADTYDVFYSRCTVVGYNHLINDMKRMEEDRINSLKPEKVNLIKSNNNRVASESKKR